MASSSALSRSLPSSSLSRSWEHDVFPSFHGPDVRKHFLSHIFKEFTRKGISPFIDNEIRRGESIGPELKRAIKESKIAIVLLSKNYASSSWCLDELVEIMNKVSGQTVLTIFHEVEPTDVKKQTGKFGKVFKETCRGKTEEKIETWRKALKGVATIAGYHSRNWDDEAAMIETIADEVLELLCRFAPSPDNFIGMGAHMEKIELLLRLDSNDEVRMIGIWGPPGIGKSTIARVLFNRHSNNFPLSAIMVNIRGSYPRPCLDEGDAQLKLQNEMLSQMINHKDIVITHLGVAQERLKDRKVLLVLDDVDRLAQLYALAGETRWFGPGSRIIITTEDQSVLDAHGMIKDIYKVPYPSTNEALQIFCMYAFGQKSPEDGFAKLAHEITHLVGNLPLGLQVMGSHFKGLKSKQKWLMELPRVKASLDEKIESILKFSYDALIDEDKTIFIHIACFFNHQMIGKVVGHLIESCPNVRQGLEVLAEKSLISIKQGMIKMHSLLARFGKEIVRQQYDRKLDKLPFLDVHINFCKDLTDPTTIERSVTGLHSSTFDFGWKKVRERVFEVMHDLQFLRLGCTYDLGDPNITDMSGHIKSISPKLRLLDWEHSPMTCLPFTINLENLVQLKMVHSKLEKLWEDIKVLRNLKWIDLSWSSNLKELPNLSTATNLQELNLSECSSLTKLPFSIGRAFNLQILDLSHCASLVVLPFSFNTKSLQKLDLSHCSSLLELPSSIGHAFNLQVLDLLGCKNLVKLPFFVPSSIENATSLRKLNLKGCSSLVELPSSIGNCTNLDELNLSCCSSMVKLPYSIGNLQRLERLNLSKCSKLEVLPTNINLESLIELDLTCCSMMKTFPEISTNIIFLYLVGTAITEVPSSIRSWARLKEFTISYHENLKDSPHAFDSITELHLTDKGIQEIGPWVKGCSRLVQLEVSGCTKLVSLPQLPDFLTELDAEGCVSLERLDCSFRNPYIVLNFVNCFKLNQEARDLIIHASTRKYNVSVLPGEEVPACFTASGGSVTLVLNEKPLRSSTQFKACIVLANKGKDKADDMKCLTVKCSITSKQNALTSWTSYGHILKSCFTGHLYVFYLEAEFDLEAEEVTSTIELVFEFKLEDYSDPWEIKECGVLQLLERNNDEDYESIRCSGQDCDSSDEEDCAENEGRSSLMNWGSNKRRRYA